MGTDQKSLPHPCPSVFIRGKNSSRKCTTLNYCVTDNRHFRLSGRAALPRGLQARRRSSATLPLHRLNGRMRLGVHGFLPSMRLIFHNLVDPPAGPQSEPPNRLGGDRCLECLGNLCLRHLQQNTRKTFEVKRQPFNCPLVNDKWLIHFSQKGAKCCRSVAGLLPILLPLKSLIIRTCCGVAGFPDLHINKVASGECMVMNEYL